VNPWVEPDEFGLRLLPALFGVLCVPVLYLAGRRLVGSKAALIAAALLVFNPWHLFWSQNARYYSLVFLLSGIFVPALYMGTEARNARWVAVGIVAAILGVLAHPTAGLVVAGFCGWLALRLFSRTLANRPLDRKTVWWGAVLALLALGVPLYLSTILSRWAAMNQAWGYTGLALVPAYVNRLSAGVSIFALAALPILWRLGEKGRAQLFALTVGIPFVVLGVLAYFVSVHVGYLFATAPFALLAAGAFLHRISATQSDAPRRWILVGACFLTVVATGLPTFVSHYLDGSRPDIRAAANHIFQHAGPDDLIVADQPGALRHYLPLSTLSIEPYRRSREQLDAMTSRLRGGSSSSKLWIVAYLRSQGGFGVQGLGRTRGWIRDQCELGASFGAVRIDYLRNDLHVYECVVTSLDP
jgi:mannosyltransferase